MKKNIFIIFLFVCSLAHSQNVTCLYQLKFRPNPEKDSLVENIYYLDIYEKQSIFRPEAVRKSDSLIQKTGLGLGRKTLFATELISKKNLETSVIEKIIITPLGNRFLIPITDTLDWKIVNEKQKIGNLNCQKAELEYGGRHWTAWFAESINLNEGPYIFYGLPGLIVKITDSNSDYDFSLMQLKKSENNDFFILKLGKEIGWTDFQKMILNYYNDPFYEAKSSGIKYVVGDDKGNLSTTSPATILKRFQKNLKNNGNNLLELNHKVEYK